jgi:uncharacterized protein
MSYADYAPGYVPAAEAPAQARAAFIRRTYLHLAGAILAFAGLEYVLFTQVDQSDLEAVMSRLFASPFSQLLVLGAFIGVGYLARMWAHASTSRPVQYLGLATYVVLQAAIFVPLLWMAVYYLRAPELIERAGVLTLCLFGGLTVAVFTTRKDFTFLGPVLSVSGFLLLGVIVLGILFNFTLGLWFSLLLVGLAAGYILYYTSAVLHHFRTDQHVAAALELFSAVALMFYYILRILLMSRGNR